MTLEGEIKNAYRRLANAVRKATWDETITGHTIVGPNSWERIQKALEKVDELESKHDGEESAK